MSIFHGTVRKVACARARKRLHQYSQDASFSCIGVLYNFRHFEFIKATRIVDNNANYLKPFDIYWDIHNKSTSTKADLYSWRDVSQVKIIDSRTLFMISSFLEPHILAVPECLNPFPCQMRKKIIKSMAKVLERLRGKSVEAKNPWNSESPKS